MKPEADEIEVEVVEVDGVAPVASAAPQETDARSRWHGRLRRLDSRWWPLWVVLGGIALSLLLTLGVVVALVFVALRLVSRLLRALFR
jgi:hypothetical protein